MKQFEWLAVALFLAVSLPAGAEPAPWYRWQSVTGDTVCAQTSPGPGWVRLDRTYVDPRCLRQDKAADRAGDSAKAKNRK